MESSISVKTSDIYYAAVNFLHGKEYGRAINLLQSISNKEGDTDLDVIHNALSTAFLQLGDAKNAMHHVLEAISINPNPMYYANLAQVEMYRFKPLEAIEECEFGLKLPDVPDKARTQLLLKQVSAFNMARMYRKGYESLKLLPKDKPEHRVYLGMAQMAEINPIKFHEGLKNYEARTEVYQSLIPKYVHKSIILDPDNLSHGVDWNILLEQGIGDCVMMLPYILDLVKEVKKYFSKEGARVNIISLDGRHDTFVNDIIKFYCDETLNSFCIESQDLYELEMEGGEFIWMFDLLKAGIKKNSGYLNMEEQIKALASQYKGKVGICWRGNSVHLNDHWRSAELKDFYPIISVYGKDCVSLQHQLSAGERDDIESLGIDKWDTPGLTALIAVISNLKAVITVDTAISHLAGAIGVECVTILPTNPDWRWGNHGSGSRFYGIKHHLTRQINCGDWSDPIIEALRIIK